MTHAGARHGVLPIVETDDVDHPPGAHGEDLPARRRSAGLFCRRRVTDDQADEYPVSEDDDLGHTGPPPRLPTPLVPSQDLVPVLASGTTGVGRAPMHVGVEKIAEGG